MLIIIKVRKIVKAICFVIMLLQIIYQSIDYFSHPINILCLLFLHIIENWFSKKYFSPTKRAVLSFANITTNKKKINVTLVNVVFAKLFKILFL
jgi:hypothetical protein